MDFPDTRWTLISHLGDPAKVGAALDKLCGVYWEPIYAYLLQSGRNRVEAQDLTQDFLEMVVRQRLLERADPVAGRMRSWLLSALHHFLANARRHESRQKRGGGIPVLPLDHQEIVPELAGMTVQGLSPDEAFDRAWATALLRRVLEILGQQYREADRESEFTALMPSLLEGSSVPQIETAARAGMTVANFRVRLHRLRGRYRETLWQAIAATLEREEDCQAEMEYLFRIVGR